MSRGSTAGRAELQAIIDEGTATPEQEALFLALKTKLDGLEASITP